MYGLEFAMTVSVNEAIARLEELLNAAARGQEIRIEFEGRYFRVVPLPLETNDTNGEIK